MDPLALRFATGYSVVSRLTDAGLPQDVDHTEQGDPHHVDEVPVVGHYNGAHGLLVSEGSGEERAPEQQDEGDQTTRDVKPMEPGGQEEQDPYTLLEMVRFSENKAAYS